MSAPVAEVAVAPPVKEDPESLVLRARPRPVLRFKRGLLIGAAGVTSAALVGLAWMALEPPSFRMAASEDREAPRGAATPDILADAPASYGDVPRLGPPLPGDLGRPILEHQRRAEAAAPAHDPAADLAAERARAAIAAEQQRLAARDAARASAVLFQLSGTSSSGSLAQASAPAPTRSISAAPLAAEQLTAGRSPDSVPVAIDETASPWTLSAGTIISASLITGLNSDLPGLVLAQVTEPVRDSATGRTVLVPQGARLIGRSDSAVAYGQERALLVWQRIVLPDGSTIELDAVPATDGAGYAGVSDKVDAHGGRLLKGIVLSTLLGVGTELGLGSGEGELVRALREAAQQNVARAGDQITRRNLEVRPTLTVRPGWPVRAVLHKPLVLRPWRG